MLTVAVVGTSVHSEVDGCLRAWGAWGACAGELTHRRAYCSTKDSMPSRAGPTLYTLPMTLWVLSRLLTLCGGAPSSSQGSFIQSTRAMARLKDA